MGLDATGGNRSGVSAANAQTIVDLRITPTQMANARELLAEQNPLWNFNQLRLPQSAPSSDFKMLISGRAIGAIGSANFYCDAMEGSFGGRDDDAPVVMEMVTSGSMVFESGSQKIENSTGRASIRWVGERWDIRCAPSTTSRYLLIPRSLIPRNIVKQLDKRALLFDVATPELQFIVNYLLLVDRQCEVATSTLRDEIAQDALAALVTGLVRSQRAQASADFANPTVDLARQIMGEYLLDDRLSPEMIASRLAVSVRSLHRAFAQNDSSIMSEIREQRLRGAWNDLMSYGRDSSVARVAAKWKFSDASHFIRSFKAEYGDTPAAYVRSKLTSGNELPRG